MNERELADRIKAQATIDHYRTMLEAAEVVRDACVAENTGLYRRLEAAEAHARFETERGEMLEDRLMAASIDSGLDWVNGPYQDILDAYNSPEAVAMRAGEET